MPRPEKIEKSKDFKGSVIRLIKSLKGYRVAIGVGLILAMASSILSLVAPNKLSEITDYITVGLKPDGEKLQEVSKAIYGNAIQNFMNIYSNADNLDIDTAGMYNSVTEEQQEEMLKQFNNLPDTVIPQRYDPKDQ